jgi:hypothetical protein
VSEQHIVYAQMTLVLFMHTDTLGKLDCRGFPRGWLFSSGPSAELSHLCLAPPRDRDLGRV